MPKRRSGGLDGGRTAKRRRQHLYLVIDDWSFGYSIRKVDLSSDSNSNKSVEELPHGHGGEQRLPPAVFRLEGQHGFLEYFAAAFDTKIIAMPPNAGPIVTSFLPPIFDVRTRSLNFGPRPKVDLLDPIYFPIADKLFVLSSGSFQVLYPPAVEEPRLLDSPPTRVPQGMRWEGSWRKLPKHPFKRGSITSYALHPDGRTIFVSTKRRASCTTYTFDTSEARLNWNQLGEWVLPFTGRAHFDCKLDAWVGLSGGESTTGYLCVCDVASDKLNGSDGQCPSWKICKEKLFNEDPAEKHVGATLVYMGGRSKFCLVQFISIDDEDDDAEEGLDEEPEAGHFLFRLTTFSLKYDKNGELTTGNSRRVRYYKDPGVASGRILEDPVAFWM